jgi:hypothetical protein
MNARLLFAALAVPCLCVAAETAIGQDRSIHGPVDPGRLPAARAAQADANSPRLPLLSEQNNRPRIEMIESWQVGDKAEVGFGRFQVGEIARGRTHTERVREDLMARENRAIAGAGLRIKFD